MLGEDGKVCEEETAKGGLDVEYIALLTVVFVIMFLAPFALSIIYSTVRKGSVLPISQEKRRDARYFGKAFSRLIEKNIVTVKDDTIMLSQMEEFIDGDKYYDYGKTVDKIIICKRHDFIAPKEVLIYNKEIYSAHSVDIRWPKTRLRAAYARESMMLADHTSVERWVDARETLIAGDECELGMSATAGNRLSVGNGCHFRRLYAPQICIGQFGRDIGGFGEKTVLEETVRTDKDYTLLDGVWLKGDICSHKGVRLCDNTVVTGNIFAETDIHIGKGAVVLGNVFTQGSVYVDDAARIGEQGSIVSMIAREKIFLGKSVCIYGYVSCEGGGLTTAKEGSVWENVS